MFSVRQAPLRGHSSRLRQLHSLPPLVTSVLLLRFFALWPLIIYAILFMQLWDTFTVFRLNSLCNAWPFGKCLSISCRKRLATLVVTILSNGGLNHMMFFLIRFRLFFLIAGSMKEILPPKPLFVNASAYIGLDLLNSSLLQEIEESLSVIFIGRCLVTTGGWFTYKGSLFGLR